MKHNKYVNRLVLNQSYTGDRKKTLNDFGSYSPTRQIQKPLKDDKLTSLTQQDIKIPSFNQTLENRILESNIDDFLDIKSSILESNIDDFMSKKFDARNSLGKDIKISRTNKLSQSINFN